MIKSFSKFILKNTRCVLFRLRCYTITLALLLLCIELPCSYSDGMVLLKLIAFKTRFFFPMKKMQYFFRTK